MKVASKTTTPSDLLGKALDYAYKLWPRMRNYAVFYSLLESCDVVQLNPLDWLTDVLGRLRDNMDEEEITQLLPYQYKKSQE